MITKKQRKQIKENRRQNIKDFFKYFVDEELLRNALAVVVLIALSIGAFAIGSAIGDRSKETSKSGNTEVVLDTTIDGSHIIVKTKNKR